jgi:hypothetical protein
MRTTTERTWMIAFIYMFLVDSSSSTHVGDNDGVSMLPMGWPMINLIAYDLSVRLGLGGKEVKIISLRS